MTSKILSRRGFLGTALATSTIGFTGIAKAQSNQTQNEKWDKEADVVVLGCGTAGLMSALQAHDGGAKVLIYDKGLLTLNPISMTKPPRGSKFAP